MRQMQLPEHDDEEVTRTYYQLENMPVIIDFNTESEDPVSAWRMGIENKQFTWKALEEDLFQATFEEGQEIEDISNFYEITQKYMATRENEVENYEHGGLSF